MVTLITTLRTIPSSMATPAAGSRTQMIWKTYQVRFRQCVKLNELILDFSDDYIDYGEYGEFSDVDEDEDITIEESQLNVTTSQKTVKAHKIVKFPFLSFVVCDQILSF